MYTYLTKIRLHHTDAAGILFFSNLFILAHDCYESFLDPDITFNMMFNDLDLVMPIVHAEADYHRPLRASDNLEIKLGLAKIGESSLPLILTSAVLRFDILLFFGSLLTLILTGQPQGIAPMAVRYSSVLS